MFRSTKDKFVSLVAHDLRSPISTAIVTTSLILSKEGESLPPNTKRLIDLIERQLQSGIRLIEKVLVISRMQSGQIQLEKNEVPISEVLAGAMDLKNLAENKGVTLINKIPGKMKLFADPILMGQVIKNLVSNAIKFCSEGDKITLFVPTEEKATIAVKDTGPGINQSFLPDIFRLEVKTTEAGSSGESGTGLGLPLSFDIMQAHGGSLRVQTKAGEGTTFFIQLPSE